MPLKNTYTSQYIFKLYTLHMSKASCPGTVDSPSQNHTEQKPHTIGFHLGSQHVQAMLSAVGPRRRDYSSCAYSEQPSDIRSTRVSSQVDMCFERAPLSLRCATARGKQHMEYFDPIHPVFEFQNSTLYTLSHRWMLQQYRYLARTEA